MHGLIQKNRFIFGVALLISVILSYWAFVRTVVINPDGICYIQSAEAMQSSIVAGMHWCDQAKWPFYSILIMLFAKISSFSFPAAAYAVDGMLSLISVLAFIAIVGSFTDSVRIKWLAAIVILAAHEFNAMRTEVIRDHGFWAFYLVSIWCLLRFFRFGRYRDALCWNLAIILVTLFRLEGAIFLLAIPFLALLHSQHNRIVSFLKLNTLTFLAGGALLIWISLHPIQQLGRLNEIQFQLIHGLSTVLDKFNQMKEALASHVLSIYSVRDAGLIAICMLVSWYIVSIAINVSLIYAILIGYAWWKKLLPRQKVIHVVLWGYIAVNILITGVFFVENLFLTKRYLTALSLTLMFWVPFSLDYLLQEFSVRKWPAFAAIFFMLFYTVGGIFNFGPSKEYIRQAGTWINTHASTHAAIYSNDFHVMYYSKRFPQDLFKKTVENVNLNAIADGKWQQYDYLALRLTEKKLAKNIDLLKQISIPPVAVFKNERGDEVIIYQTARKND